jgi:hypothetical protein
MNPLQPTPIEKTGNDNGFEHLVASDASGVHLVSERPPNRVLVSMERLFRNCRVGNTTVTALKQLVATKSSHYRQGPLEGLVIRRESAGWCGARAKLVRPDFTQAIDTHWRKRAIEWNRVDHSAVSPA